MQLKRQSVEAWQSEKHYSKGVIPVKPNPKTRNFQTSRPCEVRRSGRVTTFVVCAVFLLSIQAVMLLKLQLHDAIYRLRFYLNSLIHVIAFKFAQ